ncbi:MAG: hypothetical protein HZB91_03550 [Elusimicrobia bacterium]|nr:hypothetical protein [Elusimicrobiota bacterium]
MEGNLGPRLTQVLDWAIAQGYFVETKSLTPAFSLRGDTTNPPPRRFSVYMDGTVYVQIGVTRFAGGQDERDRLIDALNRIPIFRLDKADTGTGRNSKGKLPDLTDAELQQFFAVCDDFCKKG